MLVIPLAEQINPLIPHPVEIVLTQRLMHGPDDFRLPAEVGTYAARAGS